MKAKLNYMRPLKGSATKSFVFREGKWELEKAYRAGKFFDGFSYEVENIEAAFEKIKWASEYPMFLIQGDFIPGINLRNIRRLKKEKVDRQGKTLPPTLCDRDITLACFDIDGYSTDAKGTDAIELFIQELPAPFWEADYIYQYSASYGLFSEDKGLKVHLFFWLDKPVHIEVLRQWSITYNATKDWGKVIDSQVFVATQPVYTQRRKCTGAPDPIAEVGGLILKAGPLEWEPPPIDETSPILSKTSTKTSPAVSSSKYSIEDSIKKIVNAEAWHEEINKLALSLMGKGIASEEIKATIKGLMMAARENTKPGDLKVWQDRYDDIDRSVDGAFDLVDNPNQDDLLEWLVVAPVKKVLKEFPAKTFRKSASELTSIIDKLLTRDDLPKGISKRELKKRVKGFQEKFAKDGESDKRKKLFLDRQKRNIYEVTVNKHNFAAAAEQATIILSKSERWPPVFFYGPNLVYVDFANFITIRQKTRHADLKRQGLKSSRQPAVIPFRKPYHDLIARMGQDIRFVKFELGPETVCPEKLATVIALGMSKRHREMTGVVQSPFVDINWRVFNRKGYDPYTGLYSLIDEEIELKFMDKIDAWYFLKDELLAEFPFKSELDAAVMVASIMTLLQRPMLAQDSAGMPGFGITAPVQSSGKTTLVSVATTAIFENDVPASTFVDDEGELEKRLIAILREGSMCVLFDNVAQGTEVKSELLSTAMSGDIYKGRLLAKNENAWLASSVIWFFTGNNISFTGDFATRVYPVNLNPKMENPNTRFFQRENLLDWVLERRPKIILALISIIMAGKDIPKMQTGSRFKIWDKFIRNPLYHASGIDINDAIISNQETDMDFVNKKKLIGEIYKIYESRTFTSRQVINKGFPGKDDDSKPEVIGEILEDILGRYARSAKSVGKLLGKMVGRAFGDLNLNRFDSDRAYWKIEPIS